MLPCQLNIIEGHKTYYLLDGYNVYAFMQDVHSNLHENYPMVRIVPKPNASLELHNLVAAARFNINEEDVYAYFTHVLVDPTWRRKGIATTMYNLVSSIYGIDIRPSDTLSYDGQLFWKQRVLHTNNDQHKRG